MPDWTDVTLAYAGYLAVLACVVPRFRRARVAAVASAGAAAACWLWWPAADGSGATGASAAVYWVVVPSLVLLGTYRISGAFFVQPAARLERWLLASDAALLHRTGVRGAYMAAPTWIPEVFETFYLLVYGVVPAGAAVLLAGGSDAALSAYWTTVFAAEVTCYAALPWLQSRPPRALEDDSPAPHDGAIRRLNGWLLDRGSIQVNTLPSAHAAGAMAVALAVWSAMPAAGVAFTAIGLGITAATVLGRYHYAVDAILGVAVAAVSWAIVQG